MPRKESAQDRYGWEQSSEDGLTSCWPPVHTEAKTRIRCDACLLQSHTLGGPLPSWTLSIIILIQAVNVDQLSPPVFMASS